MRFIPGFIPFPVVQTRNEMCLLEADVQFCYNETVANEYFPMTREEALSRGYKRQDNNYDPVIPEGADTIKGEQIPIDISNVTDDILKKIFICEISGRPFRIIKQELDFYRKHNLPLPRKHYCKHLIYYLL